MNKKIIYYSDPLNDDFAGTKIQNKPLEKDYKYEITNPIRKIWSAFIYKIVARPVLWGLTKIKYHQKYKNKHLLKQMRKEGAFVYANHTGYLLDVAVCNALAFKQRNYTTAGTDAFSIWGIKNLLKDLGATPIDPSITHTKNLLRFMKKAIKQKQTITIFPERHIWPYYNKIRPYDERSFKYPAMFNAPVYTLTNCYQKMKLFNRPKVITYIDGPFYPDPTKKVAENAKYLRDCAYEAMAKEAFLHSTYEHVIYKYRPQKEETKTDYVLVSDEKYQEAEV